VVVDYSGHATAGGGPVLVHAIDPATFARAAYWNGAFGASSADDVLARLGTSGGSPVPIAVAGSGVQSRDVLEVAGSHIPVRVVTRLAALPGTPGGGVAVVLAPRSASAFRSIVSQGAPTLWARGNPGAILDDLPRAGLSTRGAVSAESLARTPSFLAISWTFDFLEAIGAVTAIVAVLGLLLYLQARQRDRDVSYALASRMGLSSRAHVVSVFVEILAMLIAAFVIGVGLAVAAARLVLGKLDVLPGAPPPPRFRVPLSMVGLLAAAVVALALIGAAAVQRRAGRARVSEVLRLAG
jgi:putative ABC transport system permease protein